MTVTTLASSVNYPGNGATTVFPYAFPVDLQANLLVQSTVIATGITTTLTVGQYSWSQNPDKTGTVTISPAPASGLRITISRVLPYVQLTKLSDNDGFYAESVEASLDYVTELCQQLAAAITNIIITGGGVPDPTIGQTGYLLTALGASSYGWVAPSVANLSLYMQKASNLSDVANAVTSRNNLGLGSAATLNVGLGANQIVQLDGSAKLPAVDGSQLTNLPSLSTTQVLVGLQLFSANGTYTRSAGVTKVKVTAIGVGGGAAARVSGTGPWSIGGGGSGEVRVGVFTPGATETITIPVATAGNNGGDTLFGSFITAKGGIAGSASGNAAVPGAAGSGGSGGQVIPSGPGCDAQPGNQSMGGGNMFGPGGTERAATTTPSQPSRYGAGCAGGYLATGTATGTAGKGGEGCVLIEEYK